VSFSSETKQELCQVIVEKDCCKKAELAAFIHGIGSLRIGRGGSSVYMTTEIPAVARRIFSLCKSCFAVTPEVRTQIRKQLGKKNIYHVVIKPENAQTILLETGLFKETEEGIRINRTVPLFLVRKSCCRHAYMRGAFLATGTLSDPGKSYHMEVNCPEEEYAKSLCALVQKMELPAKVAPRREGFVVYLKDSEAIVEVLGRIGAHKALLEMENVRITKNVKNNANRAANCDTANLEKTMNASTRQVEAIAYIQAKVGLSALPGHLGEMARIRLENPETPLKELGEMVSPPLSKSAVNHRLKKLEEIAQRLQKGGRL